MYIKLTNTDIENYTLEELRIDNPNVSFPNDIPNDVLAEYGVYHITRATLPIYDYTVERIEEGRPTQQNGEWQQVWNIIALSPEEVQQRLLAIAEEVRQERKRLLNESDWTQVADAPVNKYVWKEYRQALRDITAQVNFPKEIEWPLPPA